ncbi:MAG: MFS transporter [Caulobacteraceae bacterium]
MLASGLDFIDGSVVNVGLPAIGRSLHGDAADLQWVVNGYLLPLSALLLLGGALGDRYGRRRMLVSGLVLFATGSAACALAPTLPWLIAARAAQGLGAALMLPNSLAVLGASFEGPARSRAVGDLGRRRRDRRRRRAGAGRLADRHGGLARHLPDQPAPGRGGGGAGPLRHRARPAQGRRRAAGTSPAPP